MDNISGGFERAQASFAETSSKTSMCANALEVIDLHVIASPYWVNNCEGPWCILAKVFITSHGELRARPAYRVRLTNCPAGIHSASLRYNFKVPQSARKVIGVHDIGDIRQG